MSDMKICIVGAAGRMGQSLIRSVCEAKGATVTQAVERPESDVLGKDAGELAGVGSLSVAITDDAEAAIAASDAILDFTAPAASVAFAQLAANHGTIHVIGTTGCSQEDDIAFKQAAKTTAIIKSGNMSLGVNLLATLVEQAAKALEASDFDIEVLEMHHKHKVDAPSGTALLLGDAAAKGRGIDLAKNSVRTRDGHTGARNQGDIGFATLRGGSVIGEHTIVFAGEGETIELSHRAIDRQIFARGAVKAALWGNKKAPGFYTMQDVLGLV